MPEPKMEKAMQGSQVSTKLDIVENAM